MIDATLAALGAIRSEPEKVAAELGLPSGVFPVFGLVAGKPDPARPADVKPRLPQAAVLHRETYQTAPEADALATCDAILTAFQKSKNLPATGPAGPRRPPSASPPPPSSPPCSRWASNLLDLAKFR